MELPAPQAEKILKSDIADCPDYNGTIEVTMFNRIFINTKDLPSKIVFALRKMSTFANPDFFRLQQSRFSTWQTPKYICCADLDDSILSMPRGLWSDVISFLKSIGADVSERDTRPVIADIPFRFDGDLYPYQNNAISEILKYEHSVLVAPTGTGKTIMAIKLIADRKKPTLILVHRAELIDQWIEKITTFLPDISKKEIGILGNGKNKLKGTIDIAMIQTLVKKEELTRLTVGYDHIIIDECHHVPAISFEIVLNSFTAHYILGLTATPQRKDGAQAILYMQCGHIGHEVEDVSSLEQNRQVFFRETPFNEKLPNSALEIYQVWEELCSDFQRNEFIVCDVCKCIKEKRTPLVLSDRKTHLDILYKLLEERLQTGVKLYRLSGDMGKKARRETLANMKESILKSEIFCIVATGSLIGEGFDIPELDTLFLTMPISFKGKLIQFAGRLHRKTVSGKEIRIYDYVDANSGLTISMLKKRVAAYKKMSYKLLSESQRILKWIL